MTLNFKKGQNPIGMIFIAAILAITAIIGFTILSQFNDEVQSNDDFSTISKQETQDLTTSYPQTLDQIVISIALAMIIFSAITASLSRVNSVFGILAIFLMIATLILPMLVSNVWEDITENENITVESQFPITDFIMTYFPLLYIGYILTTGLGWILGGRFT